MDLDSIPLAIHATKKSLFTRACLSALSLACVILSVPAHATPPFALNCNSSTPGAHCPTPDARPLPEGATQVFGTVQTEHTTALFLIEARALSYLTLLKHQPGMTAERFRALSLRLTQQCGSGGAHSSWMLDRAAEQPQAILQRMVSAAQSQFRAETERARTQRQSAYIEQSAAAASILTDLDRSITALENDFTDTRPGLAERWNQSSNALIRNLPCHTVAEGMDWAQREIIAPSTKPCASTRMGPAAMARTLGPAEQALQRELLRTRPTAGDRILVAGRRGQSWDLNNNALRCEHKASLANDLRQRRALLLSQYPELYGRDGSCTINGENAHFYRCVASAPRTRSTAVDSTTTPLVRGNLSMTSGQTPAELVRTHLETSQLRAGTSDPMPGSELATLLASMSALCDNPAVAPQIAMRSPEVFNHLTHCSDGDASQGELGRIQTELCQRIRSEGNNWCGYRQEIQGVTTPADVIQRISGVVSPALDVVGCVASTAALVARSEPVLA